MPKTPRQPKPVLAGLLVTLALFVALPVFGKEDATAPKHAGGEETALPLTLDRALLDLSYKPDKPATPVLHTDTDTDKDVALNQLNKKLQQLEQQQAELQARYIKLLHANNSVEHLPPGQWPYYVLALLMLGGVSIWGLRWRGSARTQAETSATQPIPPETVELVSPVAIMATTEPIPEFLPGQNDSLAPQSQAATQIPETIKDKTASLIAQGDHQSAIQLLESHILRVPEESPLPWLLLLELMHCEETKVRYEYKRRQCQLYFNVAIPKYGSKVIENKGIESYPHVMTELIRLWPSDGITDYLDNLLRNNRDGSRTGFSIRAYNDILLLYSIIHGSAVRD